MTVYNETAESVNKMCTAPTQRRTLADAASENLRTGVLLLCKEALVTAIQDRRLQRPHLRVLAAMVSFVNTTSALAWPSRQKIAELLGMNLKTVSNILLELRNFGYLIAEKATVEEANNRRLTVYTFGNVDHETIRAEIAKWVQTVRDGQASATEKSPAPAGKSRQDGNSETGKVPPQRVEKSRPSGDSNSKRELEDKAASKEAGAKAPSPETLREILWSYGLTYLVKAYNGSRTEADIRAQLGKIVKDHTIGPVLAALDLTQREKPVDPLTFLRGVLKKGGQHSRPDTSKADLMRKLGMA